MPLDCSIFKDLDDVVNRHIALTSLLKKGADGYELRFSRRDLKAIVFAYERIWTANPLGKRICQDVNRCFGKHLLAIREAGGQCVQGLGSRNGHRRIHGVERRGGKRTKKKKTAVTQWVHDDAKEAALLFQTKAEELVELAELKIELLRKR